MGARNFQLHPLIHRGGNLFLSNGDRKNVISNIYSDQLKSMVNDLKNELTGANILLFDSTKTITDIISDSYTSGKD